VLASIGADCPHIAHVHTQFYHAMLTGSVAFATFLIAGIYMTPFIILPALMLLYIAIKVVNHYFGSTTAVEQSQLSV
jgi:hypothetical protein